MISDTERAAWLADKIGALGDYAKEAAAMLYRWPSLPVQQPEVMEPTERDFDAEMAHFDSGPPLIGRWHHGNGVLVSGSLRIAQWDCDTVPPAEFRDKVLDWVCETLNVAIDRHEGNLPAAHPSPRDANRREAALTEAQKEILAFLWGVGEIDGCGFGDRHPTERGNYWWRKHLHAAFPSVNNHFGG